MHFRAAAAFVLAGVASTSVDMYNPPNINYNTEHGIVRHILDPATQNTPLRFTQQHLRPPPPRLPSVFDIFIGISSYRDGVRCGFTLFTAFSRATHPDRVYVGVVDQVLPTDATCLDEYCKLSTSHWGECKFKDHITIDSHDAAASQGPTIARHAQQQLIRDEEFCLQLDAHSQLLADWDTKLVKEWVRTDNEMAVLTAYPSGFHMIDENGTYPHLSASHLCDHSKRSGPDDIPFATGILFIEYSERPQLSAFFGAGLSFSKCHAEKRVPVDNYTKWLFFGEESLRSYMQHPLPEAARRRRADEEKASGNRVRAVLTLPFHGDVDTTGLAWFYNGSVRSIESFLGFHGVSNANASWDQERCHQLHWVPYERPEIVEQLLPGWVQEALGAHERSNDRHNLVADTLEALKAQWAKDKDHMLHNMELMHLKALEERTHLPASVAEVLPAMAVMVALASVALVTRWRRRCTTSSP
ncbi:hypothetical protein AaE_005150, partial [Aphanomyces astaci]